MSSNDFSALEKMIYSGRGITVGLTPNGHPFIGYSLTGRSASSQARELVYDEKNQVIRTSVTDQIQLEKGNQALLLYPAVAYFNGYLVASNGAQTKLILSEAKRNPNRFPEEILTRAMSRPFYEYDEKEGWIDLTSYEPDAPNFTPRINACLFANMIAMHIIKKSASTIASKTDITPNISLSSGQGRLITTYLGGNENPLLSFEGGSLSVQIGSNHPEDIVDSIYRAIHGGQNPGDNYRVAAAVMMRKNGEIKVAIRNRNGLGV